MAEQKEEISTERTPTGQRTTQTTSVEPSREEKRDVDDAKDVSKANYFVYYILGALEILFAFRLIFKLAGANPTSGFVSFIYSLSGFFIAPFVGIFHTATADGDVVRAIFEPATLVAMAVYLIVFLGIAKLIESLNAGKKESK